MNEMKEILLPGEPAEMEEVLPREAILLFAPIDKRAFGAAIGIVSALGVIVLTSLQLVLRPEPAMNLDLLSQYLPGYSQSWIGVLVGGLWALGIGFVAGWFTAFMRNLSLALSLFFIRSKAELSVSRDFLDHI
jgi:hypothetical protein